MLLSTSFGCPLSYFSLFKECMQLPYWPWHSTSSHCTFLGVNVVTWRSKNRMLLLLGLKPTTLLQKCYRFVWPYGILALMILCNRIVIIKHLKVGCHFFHDLFMRKQIFTPCVCFDTWLGNIWMKPLAWLYFEQLSFKLGLFDLYAPAWGGVS